MVAAEMCKLRPRGNTGNSPYLPAAQASTLMGVSEDLVRDAKRLLRHGDEELLQAVREGIQTVSGAVQEKDRKKSKAQLTFLKKFAQRLDRALQGRNEHDAQVVYAAKPLLQYLTLRIHHYLEPRAVADWRYAERGEEVATERRARLAALLPRAREAARAFPGRRCPDCGLPLLSTLTAPECSYCAVCKGNLLWE